MTEIWENLPKNQEDAEKIEQAITRNIGDHLDDANAHVEAGQSLQSHKAAKVIDHLTRSIVGDKFNNINRISRFKGSALITTCVNGTEEPLVLTKVLVETMPAHSIIDRFAYLVQNGVLQAVARVVEVDVDDYLIFDTWELQDLEGMEIWFSKMLFSNVNDDWALGVGGGEGYNDESVSSSEADAWTSYEILSDTIVVLGTIGPDKGKINIYIDDLLEEVVDLYNQTNIDRFHIFEKTFETTATRTIKLEVRSDKNALSSGYELLLNGYDINGVMQISSLQFAVMKIEETINYSSYGQYSFYRSAPEGWTCIAIKTVNCAAADPVNDSMPVVFVETIKGTVYVRYYGFDLNTNYDIEVEVLIVKKDDIAYEIAQA